MSPFDDADSDRITEARWDTDVTSPAGLHGLVFTRDALQGLIPLGGTSRSRSDFAVRLEDDSEETRSTVVRFLGQRDRHSLTRAVCDLVEEIGQLLARYGEAVYEVVSRDDGEEEDDAQAAAEPKTSTARLELVPALTVKALGPLVVQITPRIARETGIPIARIPRSKLVWIKLPSALGTPRQHRRMLRRLARVEAATRHLTPADFPKGYDFVAARRADDAESVRLARRWGVLAFMRPQNATDYFNIAGTIANRRAQALVREHVISELNAALSARGLPRIRVEGLPSSAEIEEALGELAAGTIDFKQANERTEWW